MRRQNSCTCGSLEAFTSVLVPRTSAALGTKFSVVVTLAQSSQWSLALRPPSSQSTSTARRRSTMKPRRPITSTCGSISRTPSVQPLTTFATRTTPKRASGGWHQHHRRSHLIGQAVLGRFEAGIAVAKLEHAPGVVDCDLVSQRAEDFGDRAHISDRRNPNQAHRLALEQARA
jgi:hypothetical protein